MRIKKYLFGIWAAVAVYTIFSFLGGPKGLSAYNYLLNEREYQLEHIRELGALNDDLERTRNNLIYDYDTILVHARQLGYGRDDEHFIRIVGLGSANSVPTMPGTIYSAQKPVFISDLSIKITALSIGLLVFIFLFMLEIIDKRTR